MAGAEKQYTGAGMDDYVSKPIQPEVLFDLTTQRRDRVGHLRCGHNRRDWRAVRVGEFVDLVK